MGVGMPQSLLLQQFGEYVRAAFGHMPYHVGSSLRNKDGWRDVDVRLLIPDDEYERLQLGAPDRPQWNKRWRAITLAWSSFGRTLTGLPIDFQIQQLSYANSSFPRPEHQRSALFDSSASDQSPDTLFKAATETEAATET